MAGILGILIKNIKEAAHYFKDDLKQHILIQMNICFMLALLNLNFKIHQLGGSAAKLVKSSWEEYADDQKLGLCKKNIILDQFNSVKEYKAFVLETLPALINKKELDRELAVLLLES